ncbi:hypothetical protein Pelo_19897 [Pelomyxa schiedti]|nr:hypothetical protein Pelo_19897 [Pelomyxa schiedti]
MFTQIVLNLPDPIQIGELAHTLESGLRGFEEEHFTCTSVTVLVVPALHPPRTVCFNVCHHISSSSWATS